MKNIINYILKKGDFCGIDKKDTIENKKYFNDYDLMQNLNYALNNFCIKHGYIFEEFFYDNEPCTFEDSLPQEPQKYYRYETSQGLPPAPKDLYIHVFNNDIKNLNQYIKDFLHINSDVCFSNINDNLHHIRKNTIAVIMEGAPTHSFNYDCWSFLDKNGNRYATRSYYDFFVNDSRSEHWLKPKDSKVKFLIYCDKTEKIVQKVANKLKIDTMHVNCLKDF